MKKNRRGQPQIEKSLVLWGPRRDEMIWLYHDQRWSMQRIAGYYNVSQAGISKVFKRMGIQSRGKGRIGAENGRYKDGKQNRQYRQLIVKDKCSICDRTDLLVIHHKNGDHLDNHLENLQVLCDSCHNRYHKTLWWKKKKASKREKNK
ncbi:MAG: HNH endonuclease [candidate division Zixibacteria bacterium]|nr:HNH endonuclease [candidate division Zixibacteria bacterium]